MGYRRRVGGGKNQAIARAVGLKTYKGKLTVLDATAGLGRDAFVLATLGCRVHLVERSPVITLLLLDGLRRARQDKALWPALDAMEVTEGDAKKVLERLEGENCPDVVYLDPMFPAHSQGALTKIEMRLLRELVGDDQDADALLGLALVRAKRRVVVKRPRHAPTLLQKTPSFVVEGKTNRYDVYLTGGDHTHP